MSKDDQSSLPVPFHSKSLLTLSEVARALRKPLTTVRGWCQRKCLDAQKAAIQGVRGGRIGWVVSDAALKTFTPPRLGVPPGSRLQTRDTELGRERRCTKCREWWPDDKEFFYSPEYGWCVGCHREKAKASWYARFPLSIVRRRRSNGVLVLVNLRQRVYAALYPADADTSEETIREDIRRRGYGRRLSAGFRLYDLTTGKYLPYRNKQISHRLKLTPRERAARRQNHPWRLADRASYLLWQARAAAKRKKA